MKHVSAIFLQRPAPEARFVVMKKTAFGLIDVCRYHESIGDAFIDLVGLATADYEIVKIDREEVKA